MDIYKRKEKWVKVYEYIGKCISHWLFNMFMDGGTKEMKVKDNIVGEEIGIDYVN